MVAPAKPASLASQAQSFLTFEEEIRRLAELTRKPIPPLTEGPRAFFSSLSSWFGTSPVDALLPDPSLNISLPYGREEISLALALGTGHLHSQQDIEFHADAYGLHPDLLDRPVLSLSGGERMLLSLAKFAALARPSFDAVVCSPFFWLDTNNRRRVDMLFSTLADRAATAHLLLLEGELIETSSEAFTEEQEDIPPLAWQLMTQSLRVYYPAQTFPRRSPGKEISFETTDPMLPLQSPTILSGPNGVGKTTLAKCLAGLIEPASGYVSAVSGGFDGRARLILQDPLLHLFSLDPHHHLLRVFSHDSERRKQALDLYSRMEQDIASIISRDLPGVPVGGRSDKSSILQAKLALTAERLVTPTPLLIFDEPGWCLSRPIARAFLSTVVRSAHQLGTAVLLISHQATWWDGLVRSKFSLANAHGRIAVEEEDL